MFLNELADGLAKRFNVLEKYVVGSGLAISLSSYFNVSIKLTLLILTLTFTVSSIITTQIFKLELVKGTAAVLSVVLIVFSLSILTFLALPKILHANRGYKLEARYPAFLYFFSTLMVSGLGSIKALLELNNFRELNEFRIELEQIINGLHLGKSLDDVINYVITITPCRSLASLLTYLLGVIKSGHDPLPIINYLIESYFVTIRSRIEEVVNSMGVLTEAFIALALVFPLVVSVLSSTTSLIPIGVLNPYLLLIITALVIVPATSLTYYILIDYMMSSVSI
ncbi:MAG: type II secretion system F family protein [Sulfolobales archaeon]